MAKTLSVFFSHIKHIFKYVLLFIAIFLFVIVVQSKLFNIAISPVFASTPTLEQLQINAQSLTKQGHKQLESGNPESALKTWQEAMKVYTELHSEEGILGSQINQSLALQALGKYRQACKTLVTVLKGVDGKICDPSTENELAIPEQPKSLISAIGLRNFGDVLRVIGKLDKSVEALKLSLDIAKKLPSSPEISATYLSLGNTERALYNQELDSYQRTKSIYSKKDVIKHASTSLCHYLNVTTSTSKIVQIQGKLNRLSLLWEFEPLLRKGELNQVKDLDLCKILEQNKNLNEPELLNYLQSKQYLNYLNNEIKSQIKDLLQNQSEIASLPLNRTAIYIQLNFAQILICLKKNKEAIHYFKTILQWAGDKDQRSEAYVLGILGRLYEKQSLSDALTLIEKAVKIANEIQARDIAYRLEHQLGKLYKVSGKIKEAMAAYDASVNSLKSVSKDLAFINPDVQFSFRDNIQNIYQEYLELLLHDDTNKNTENLSKVIEIRELLQKVELENIFNCDLSKSVPIDKSEELAAIIYPIILNDTLEIIVKLPHIKINCKDVNNKNKECTQIKHYTTIARKTDNDKKEFENFNNTIEELKQYLKTDKEGRPTIDEDQILPLAKRLYNWIIKPFINELPKQGTLVFVLDAKLQNIPMAILHNGIEYLVNDYSISVSLGSQLKEPKRLQQGRWNVLLAGIYEEYKNFNGLKQLPNIKDEINKIKATVPNYKLLLNDKFTVEAFKEQINATPFPVVHIATHGQFSSDPKETVIYASDKKINLQELSNIFNSRGKISRDPIELLVLSACNTAKGDERNVLGIAGIALKAKVRSIVASLWTVNDDFAPDFMEKFYEKLNAENMTKAEAIRQVQIDFLRGENSDYQHPSYWSNFILSGNWL